MTFQTEFTMQTETLAKIAAFLQGLGLTNEQLSTMVDTLSIDQCKELGENLNVFENLDFGIIDEPEDPEHGQLYVYHTLKSQETQQEISKDLVRYPDEAPTVPFQPRWVSISEIVVPTEYDKEQLLLAIEYIHYLREIDTDIMAVNTLVHLYQDPDRITVKSVT